MIASPRPGPDATQVLPVVSGRRISSPPGSAGGKGRHARPRRRHRWLRRFLVAVLVLVLLVVGGAAGALALSPSVTDAPARVQAILVANHAPSDGGVVPTKVGEALLATEDSRYYHDRGIDPRGVVRGGWGFVTGNAAAGGATIEIQLAKLLYTPGHAGASALAEQMALAVKFDRHFTKTQILAMYLDAAYFGDGQYGITAASEHYFGVPADDLTWGQASLLAGLVQAPTNYDPHGHLTLALQRRSHVLDRLVATGVLTPAEADQDSAAPLNPAVPFTG